MVLSYTLNSIPNYIAYHLLGDCWRCHCQQTDLLSTNILSEQERRTNGRMETHYFCFWCCAMYRNIKVGECVLHGCKCCTKCFRRRVIIWISKNICYYMTDPGILSRIRDFGPHTILNKASGFIATASSSLPFSYWTLFAEWLIRMFWSSENVLNKFCKGSTW